MERYEKYKDSGIEWLGEIPEHWEIKKLKYLALIGNGKDHKNVWKNDGEYPIIGTGGKFGNANTFLYDKPSVILGRKGTIDKPQFVDVPFWAVDTAYYTIIKETTFPKFLYYLTITINFDLYKYGSAVPSMNQEVLKDIYFAVPNKSEQTIIASYLDRKTAEIANLIAHKEQLLRLYEEEKTALINQAVTKGLNPHVPMKDSGIDWLGEIPEHWEVKKLSYLFGKIGSGTTPKSGNPEYYENGSINWLQTGDLNDDEIYYTSKLITEAALKDYSTLRFYPQDSIVIAMYGATIGKTGILKIEATTNQACCVLAEPENIKTKFAFYWFNSAKKHIISLSYGGGQPNINQEMIRTLKVQLPPKEEQVAIIQYIEKETARIDAKVTKTQKLIELLKEYKTALISEVVTGKVKVI